MARGDGETWLRGRPVPVGDEEPSRAMTAWHIGSAVVLVALGSVLVDPYGYLEGGLRAVALMLLTVAPLEWLVGPRIGIPRKGRGRWILALMAVSAAFLVAVSVTDGDAPVHAALGCFAALLAVDGWRAARRVLEKRRRSRDARPALP